jgi:peptidoglycan hydrolase CwlO-like protein
MTTQEQTTDRALGRLEANVENLQTSVADLKIEIQQTNARIDQTNSRIDQTNARIDLGNGKIDRLFFAIIGIGGGIIAALIAMILRGP